MNSRLRRLAPSLPTAIAAIAAAALLGAPGCSSTSRLHEIDSDPASGFAIYRSGQPTAKSVRELCDLGIRELYALNGEGSRYRDALARECPGARITYDASQDADSPISADFLAQFDKSVEEAKAAGTKILFHCSCGCHRTGRLAAYYRIKFDHWSAESAIEEMHAIGEKMDEHPTLDGQVRAMEEYVQTRSCSPANQNYCVRPSSVAKMSAM